VTLQFRHAIHLLLAATALLAASALAIFQPQRASASAPVHVVGPDAVVVERAPAAVAGVVVASSHCDTDGLTVLSPEGCGH
jgi:hypothetical protein